MRDVDALFMVAHEAAPSGSAGFSRPTSAATWDRRAWRVDQVFEVTQKRRVGLGQVSLENRIGGT